MSAYEDSYEQGEKNLNLHLAKMIEHMEWESTLPDAEKSKRRLIQFISQLPQTAELAARHEMPWVLFGCLERIVTHADEVLGKDWLERARQERRAFLYEDDED